MAIHAIQVHDLVNLRSPESEQPSQVKLLEFGSTAFQGTGLLAVEASGALQLSITNGSAFYWPQILAQASVDGAAQPVLLLEAYEGHDGSLQSLSQVLLRGPLLLTPRRWALDLQQYCDVEWQPVPRALAEELQQLYTITLGARLKPSGEVWSGP